MLRRRKATPAMTDKWSLPPLTLHDRCDYPDCNLPALVRVVLSTGDVYVCTRHYVKHEAALNARAVYVHDERVTPAASGALDELGRMHMRRGLTHRDPCRWCTRKLVKRRFYDKPNHTYREYFLCPGCDQTAAPDMETLKGLTA